MTLTPAYGRDYKSKKDVLSDWNSNKDFIVSDFFDKYDGKPINLSDAKHAGIREVMIRYSGLRKIAVIKIKR